jgi:hypothetical protein
VVGRRSWRLLLVLVCNTSCIRRCAAAATATATAARATVASVMPRHGRIWQHGSGLR